MNREHLCSATVSSHSMSGSRQASSEANAGRVQQSVGVGHFGRFQPVTTFSTASRARLRRASGTASATLRAQAARHQAADPAQRPRPAARVAGSAAAGGGSVAASSGRKPCVAAAASRGLPAPGRCRYRPSRLVTVPARADRPSSSRQPSCRRAKITVKGARCARVADAMALRATLDTDLPRQDTAPIRRTGKKSRSFALNLKARPGRALTRRSVNAWKPNRVTRQDGRAHRAPGRMRHLRPPGAHPQTACMLPGPGDSCRAAEAPTLHRKNLQGPPPVHPSHSGA